jgi:hypothetical protein
MFGEEIICGALVPGYIPAFIQIRHSEHNFTLIYVLHI